MSFLFFIGAMPKLKTSYWLFLALRNGYFSPQRRRARKGSKVKHVMWDLKCVICDKNFFSPHATSLIFFSSTFNLSVCILPLRSLRLCGDIYYRHLL
jgi:hypothetical protein